MIRNLASAEITQGKLILLSENSLKMHCVPSSFPFVRVITEQSGEHLLLTEERDARRRPNRTRSRDTLCSLTQLSDDLCVSFKNGAHVSLTLPATVVSN